MIKNNKFVPPEHRTQRSKDLFRTSELQYFAVPRICIKLLTSHKTTQQHERAPKCLIKFCLFDPTTLNGDLF